MTRETFHALTTQSTVLLDGATGTNLYAAGMPRGISTERWNLSHPQHITVLQQAYVRAGSHIVYAPTFSANELALEAFGLRERMEQLNADLVRLSREAVGTDILVAGDMSSLGKPLIPENGLSFDQAFAIYRNQAQALFDAGVDLFAIETMMGLEESVAALQAVRSVCDLPVLCTLSVSADGEAIFDGNIFEAAETLSALEADAVGINCSAGPDQLEAVISTLRNHTDLPIVAKPNAGMPEIDTKGNVRYSMDPQAFARHMLRLKQCGASILGGCCGTTPAHIAALHDIL